MLSSYNLPVRYGVLGGFIMAISSLLSYVFYRQLFSSMMTQAIFGFLFLAVIIFIPVWGTVSYKRVVGSLNFPQAFLVSLIILSITMAFSGLISYLIPNVIDTEYPTQLFELVQKNTTETMEKFGSPDAEIEKALERIKLEDFKPTLTSTFRSFGVSVGVGSALSVLIALFVSRPNREQTKVET